MGAIKLLSVDDSGVQLEDGINVIERLTGALRIIVMIGDGRAGKSFLANKIVGEEIFAHAPTPEAVTAGIDLYAVPFIDGHLLLWDCEGGNNALAKTHQMVNVLGMVAASKIVYVVAGMATDAAFETLERNFASRELVMQGNSMEHQEFVFLVNKNNLTYEPHHFDNMLNDRKGNAISALYPSEMRDFLTLGFEGTPNFEGELEAILTSVKDTRPRTLAGMPMSGPQLAELLRLVYNDFESRGKVEMPAMARVVIYDNYLRPLAITQINAFAKVLPAPDRECFSEDPEQYDTRKERLDAFMQKTSHISAIYGDFRSDAYDELEREMNTRWEVFVRRNKELGEVVVKTWTDKQTPFSFTKTKEAFDMFGRKKNRYIDVHDVQTRVVTLRANGNCEYDEWVTVSREERNERDQHSRRKSSVYADLETTPQGWLGDVMRAVDRFFSGGVEHDDGEEGMFTGPLTIHDAAYRGELDRLKDLIAEGADVNDPAELTLMTPLHQAARSGYVDIVTFLLENKNIHVNALDSWLATPLHNACAEGHVQIVNALLDFPGVETAAQNHFKQTPLDLAIKYNRSNVIQLLRGVLNDGQEQR